MNDAVENFRAKTELKETKIQIFPPKIYFS